jgi:hypothetical protein
MEELEYWKLCHYLQYRSFSVNKIFSWALPRNLANKAVTAIDYVQYRELYVYWVTDKDKVENENTKQ